jgi:hypothetical protein
MRVSQKPLLKKKKKEKEIEFQSQHEKKGQAAKKNVGCSVYVSTVTC